LWAFTQFSNDFWLRGIFRLKKIHFNCSTSHKHTTLPCYKILSLYIYSSDKGPWLITNDYSLRLSAKWWLIRCYSDHKSTICPSEIMSCYYSKTTNIQNTNIENSGHAISSVEISSGVHRTEYFFINPGLTWPTEIIIDDY